MNHATSPKLYRSYYPCRSRDSLSPVCGIFSSAVQLTAHGTLHIAVETVLHCFGLKIATADLNCYVQLCVRHLFWDPKKTPDKRQAPFLGWSCLFFWIDRQFFFLSSGIFFGVIWHLFGIIWHFLLDITLIFGVFKVDITD